MRTRGRRGARVPAQHGTPPGVGAEHGAALQPQFVGELVERAERVEGFDQAPDFIVPDEWNPQIVIEAKITEDDGTARDKVTRIQHLAEISRSRGLGDQPSFQVIACIDGRGFGVRREDMRKLLQATQGKVFTLRTLGHLIENTLLQTFKTG